MFEGLFKPKFDSKCKSHARLIKTRLEVIRKKRNAVQKFLQKDIADLLKSGLDYNAYGRAEGLLVEKNMSSCYEFIPKFIECISVHARDLCKKRECPDECKEAISSLIYAAARFPDLPELRDLRTLFTEKFANSLEPYTCKEFVNKLRQDPPSKEMKIRLLRDLAQEFSIKWDSKVLEQRIYSTPQLHEEKPKHDYVPKCHKIDMPKRNENASEDKTKGCSSSLRRVSEDEVENKRPFSYGVVQPPSNDEGVIQEKKEKPRSVRTRGSREKAVDVVLMHYSKKESEMSTTTPMRVHERATSLVPEMLLSSTAKHVHPSLPDYEDFTARLAYLHSRT